jgi:ferric-dicitrate binding protein FerR (iron transport regulator)
MQNTNKIDSLIARSFTEALTPEDQECINSWLNESTENQKHYRQLINIWQSSHPVFDIDSNDIQVAEKKLLSKLDKPSFFQIPLIIWWQRIAAVLLLPALFLMGYLMNKHFGQSEQFAYQEISTPYGAISHVSLPDGSSVWLNSGSQLKFPSIFRGNERHVFLSGEGYFTVHSDKQHPFIVETAKMSVRATGTRFNVEAYLSDTIVAVTLVEGIVGVNAKNKTHTTLNPNQRIIFNSNSHTYSLTNTDVQQWILWKEGKLVFRDEPLDEVFKRLGRAFNVDISIKDKFIAKQPYRATFEGESLDEILRLLKLTTPLRYERSGKVKHQNDIYSKEKIDIYRSEQ